MQLVDMLTVLKYIWKTCKNNLRWSFFLLCNKSCNTQYIGNNNNYWESMWKVERVLHQQSQSVSSCQQI